MELQIWWVRSIWAIAQCKPKWIKANNWKGHRARGFEKKCMEHNAQWEMLKARLEDMADENANDRELLRLVPTGQSSEVVTILRDLLE